MCHFGSAKHGLLEFFLSDLIQIQIYVQKFLYQESISSDLCSDIQIFRFSDNIGDISDLLKTWFVLG